jgi:KEOPS complex subunit Pcc1
VTSKKSTSPEASHEAVIRFPHESASRARTVTDSVRRELGQIPGRRTTASVTREGSTVRVMLEADDLAALRAGTFTWCGLIEAAAKTASQFDD